MSTTTNTIQLEISYTDYSERTYKIPYKRDISEGTEATKTAIRAFNTAAADSNSAVAQTFLSNTGAPAASITSATLVKKTEEVIYNG